MSIDTTILCLKTNNEYRVAIVQAAENITLYRDLNVLKFFFSRVPVFHSINEALLEADRLEDLHIEQVGFPSEYGICEFDFGGPFPI